MNHLHRIDQPSVSLVGGDRITLPLPKGMKLSRAAEFFAGCLESEEIRRSLAEGRSHVPPYEKIGTGKESYQLDDDNNFFLHAGDEEETFCLDCRYGNREDRVVDQVRVIAAMATLFVLRCCSAPQQREFFEAAVDPEGAVAAA